MRYIAAEDVAKAKEMDLLTYLRNYEPQELVHVSGNTYCTREHDSLRISNGKWCWFSQGIGGRSALDYLIKVKGIPFTQAAEIILGREAEKPPVFYRQKERKHNSMLRSGKELKVFAIGDRDMEKFCREAKKYGILYCVLKDKTANDGHTDVFVRAEDASKINRIFERFGIATADIGSARTEIVKAQEEQKNADIPVPDRNTIAITTITTVMSL